ncbi:hypothetical protein [Hyperthermus butylicus]|uniref:Uncharacterized protein n=1 Tax=Hyperthermus butylicus (strain DSM 5456 / JCM 9403 / PLM1-5) TaxID=415426 RepID=A2BJK4_HYPBU|nr:hypothetical protein [Hyperthermus butylicus]ABM80165.1 hypothetical protein Hbut_0293 [Hyperthermus butylicus DSM 5456]
MLVAARYSFAIVSAILMAGLVAPLLVFGIEVYMDKSLFEIYVVSAKPYNATHLDVTVKVVYRGSVPLTDAYIYSSGSSAKLGTLGPGYSQKLVHLYIPVDGAEDMVRLGFKIAGIYQVMVEVKLHLAKT